MTTFIAAIGTASDVVTNGFCDVAIAEADEVSYHVANDGTETPIYGMSNRLVMEPTDMTVSVNDDDKLAKAQSAAEDVLANHGWELVDSWEIVDNAMYATVERF